MKLIFFSYRFLRVHDGPVTGLSLHATGDYILSTSTVNIISISQFCFLKNVFSFHEFFFQDQHWAFSDIRTGKLIAKVTDSDNGNGPALTCCHSHPDGLIFGTGTSDAMIKIWDLKEVR